jgi:hypothetical protein
MYCVLECLGIEKGVSRFVVYAMDTGRIIALSSNYSEITERFPRTLPLGQVEVTRKQQLIFDRLEEQLYE